MKKNKGTVGWKQALLGVLGLLSFIQPAWPDEGPPAPKIQMGILLDASNSMDGLIDQTKRQLWKIVNELEKARKDGAAPLLEVALYEYGKDTIPREEGHLQLLTSGLTGDLDEVSEKLFALKTRGGSEFAGQVIQAAHEGLAWSPEEGDFKTLFVAGNESFAQGEVDFHESIAAAVADGITVNTIHAGPSETGVNHQWAEGAEIGQGVYAAINHQADFKVIPSPYDQQIKDLNDQLNHTYLPYGKNGYRNWKRMWDEDRNAGAWIVDRGRSKAGRYYWNPTWDLVDAVNGGTVRLEDIPDSELPKEMQGMSLAEKKAYVQAKSDERKRLQAEIKELYKLREEYVQKKRLEEGFEEEELIHSVIVKALKGQLASKGFDIVEE